MRRCMLMAAKRENSSSWLDVATNLSKAIRERLRYVHQNQSFSLISWANPTNDSFVELRRELARYAKNVSFLVEGIQRRACQDRSSNTITVTSVTFGAWELIRPTVEDVGFDFSLGNATLWRSVLSNFEAHYIRDFVVPVDAASAAAAVPGSACSRILVNTHPRINCSAPKFNRLRNVSAGNPIFDQDPIRYVQSPVCEKLVAQDMWSKMHAAELRFEHTVVRDLESLVAYHRACTLVDGHHLDELLLTDSPHQCALLFQESFWRHVLSLRGSF